MLWSANLSLVIRYFDMTFWEKETQEEIAADAQRPSPRLESVADHSWHLCDIITLLHPHFPYLDLGKCLYMATLHDKLEIITGDLAPMGKSGTGFDGTAYNASLAAQKSRSERRALSEYLATLPKRVADEQRRIFEEYVTGESKEACFVHGIDKLQVHTWLIRKKTGHMTDDHLRFSIRYVRSKSLVFEGLEPYVFELEDRLLSLVARKRRISRARLDTLVNLDDIRMVNR